METELNDLKDPEHQKKLMEAKTPEELIAIAKEHGMELDSNQLNAIAGGGGWYCDDRTCYQNTCPLAT